MHVQMGISNEVEAQLENLLKELRLAHVAEEIELKKLLHKCTASGRQADLDAYENRVKLHKAQGAKLTVTNVLRAALQVGLRHIDKPCFGSKDSTAERLLAELNKVGVARGYGKHGKAA